MTPEAVRFATTPWAIIDEAQAADADERALARLCELYWPPIYNFLRRAGLRPDRAADATQDFFATKVLAGEIFTKARRERGRLRTLLLTALRHHQVDQARRRQRQVNPIPADALEVQERRFAASRADDPDRAFHEEWALQTLQAALGATRRWCAKADRSDHWRIFEHCVLTPARTGNRRVPNADAATLFDVPPRTVSDAIHGVREKLRLQLVLAVQRTAAPDAYDDEVRDILALLHW